MLTGIGSNSACGSRDVANNTYRTSVILHCPPVAWAGKCRVQLTADERLDELANPFAQTALDRIEPVVEKVRGGIGCRLCVVAPPSMAAACGLTVGIVRPTWTSICCDSSSILLLT
jgi:hypothetical protein